MSGKTAAARQSSSALALLPQEMSESLRICGLDTSVAYRATGPCAVGTRCAFRHDPKGTRPSRGFLYRPHNLAVEQKRRRISVAPVTNDGALEADLVLLRSGSAADAFGRRNRSALGQTGAIAVDSCQQTSQEGIYAVATAARSSTA